MKPITQFRSPTKLTYTVSAGTVATEFLSAILERRIVGRRCPVCTKVYVPPRPACPTCAVLCEEPVELPEVGTVTTFSVVRIPFPGQLLEPPYACAHVLLDGADVPLLHIVGGVDVDDVRMGLRVTAVWSDEPEPTLASIRYFTPNGEPDADYASFREHV